VEELQPERDLGSTPFFQVVIEHDSGPREPLRLAGVEAEAIHLAAHAKFDLSLGLMDAAGAIRGEVEYK